MRKTTIAVVTGCLAGLAWAAECPDVRIYLLRDVKVEGETIRLGELGVVLSDDAKAEAAARELAMGRAPWPKESLFVDRTTVLSRLASCGIDRHRVRFTGADKVAVMRDEKTVSPQQILAAAEKFLQDSPPADAPRGCIHQVVREPQEIVLPGGGGLELSCTLDRDAQAGRLKVLVAARRDGNQLALREVLYKRMYPVRSAVVKQIIPTGAPVTDENVEVQTEYSDRPEQADWKPPHGQLAVRQLQPGTVLRPALTAERRPDLVIRRNQAVRMRVQGLGFVVTGVGQALEEGRPGEYIKVRNVDSARVVTALVAFDGSVEPVYQR